MPFRQIWTYTDPNGAFWTESFFVGTGPIAAVAAKVAVLLPVRLPMLYPTATLRLVRTSDLDNPRSVIETIVNLPGLAPSSAGPADQNAAVVWDLHSSGGLRRKWWMRGAPADFFKRDPLTGRNTPPAVMLTAFAAFILAASTAGYGIRALKRAKDRTPPGYVTVTLATQVSAGVTELTLTDGTLVWPGAPGGRVILSLFSQKDLPRLNGHYTLVGSSAGKIRVAYQLPWAGPIPTPGGRVSSEAFQDVDTFAPLLCQFDHYGSHDTRDDFFSSRGSRRAGRIRLSP